MTTVRVTVENLSKGGGIYATPVWVAAHKGTFDTFNKGQAASAELEKIAEDGNNADLRAAFASANTGVDGVVLGTDGVAGPLDDGEIASVKLLNVNAKTDQYFSYASMVIPSNDAFVGNDNPTAYRLFDSSGKFIGKDFIVKGSEVLDGGTEKNTETDAAFLDQTAPNTGETENGTVQDHLGFNGSQLNPGGTARILGGTNAAGEPITAEAADFTRDNYNFLKFTFEAFKQINGSERGNTLFGSSKQEDITGLGGNDYIFGRGGKDLISGGNGSDKLFGDNGNDEISGETGNDLISGGNGSDKIEGGDGKDRVYGGSEGDQITGGEGDDTVYGQSGNDLISGNDGRDQIYGGNGVDRIAGGNDNDRLYGDRGDDTLFGQAGNDRLDGGSGENALIGGLGQDRLTGGKDSDQFIYKSVDESVAGSQDRIYSFSTLEDTLDLSALSVDAASITITENSSGNFTVSGSDNLAIDVYTVRANDLTMNDIKFA